LFQGSKKASGVAGLFRRRYFVFMGCSKNYIMYWGGYEYYNSTGAKISLHKHQIINPFFLCILGTSFSTFWQSAYHIAQKPLQSMVFDCSGPEIRQKVLQIPPVLSSLFPEEAHSIYAVHLHVQESFFWLFRGSRQ
jgi:hypothetical protein